jgi:hypothetical protein
MQFYVLLIRQGGAIPVSVWRYGVIHISPSIRKLGKKSSGLAGYTARYTVPIRASRIVPHFTAQRKPIHSQVYLRLPSLASRRRHGQGVSIATSHGAHAARI